MRLLTFIIIAFIFAGCNSTNPKSDSIVYPFYLGTYTYGPSEGIYSYSLLSDGSIDSLGLAAITENPSFIIKDLNNKYLLATNEVASNGTGFIESFLISGDGLIHQNRTETGGAHPCHIDIDNEGMVLVSNYSGGNVGLFNLDKIGVLSDLLYLDKHTGYGTTPRQKGPHAHSAYFLPNTNQIISADLGTNELWLTKLDSTKTSFLIDETIKLPMEKGAGPRHICFNPRGNWLYVINELNSSITQVEYNQNGEIKIVGNTSTLPDGFRGSNDCADIHITNDGNFLYASNRGHNSIAIFKVMPTTGELVSSGHVSTHGNWPRNFALTPDDKFLVVANRRSNNITSFKRNKETGSLQYLNQINAPEPVCILF